MAATRGTTTNTHHQRRSQALNPFRFLVGACLRPLGARAGAVLTANSSSSVVTGRHLPSTRPAETSWSSRGALRGRSAGAGHESLVQVVPVALGAYLDHVTPRAGPVGGHVEPDVERPHASVVVLQPVPVDVRHELELGVMAHRAFPPRWLAYVLGGTHQLGMGVADVGPRGEPGPNLVDQGALGERVVHRREQRAAASPDREPLSHGHGRGIVHPPPDGGRVGLARDQGTGRSTWARALACTVRSPATRNRSPTGRRTLAVASKVPRSHEHVSSTAPFRSAYSPASAAGSGPSSSIASDCAAASAAASAAVCAREAACSTRATSEAPIASTTMAASTAALSAVIEPRSPASRGIGEARASAKPSRGRSAVTRTPAAWSRSPGATRSGGATIRPAATPLAPRTPRRPSRGHPELRSTSRPH